MKVNHTTAATRSRWDTWLTWPVRRPYWTLLLCVVLTGMLAVPASRVRSDSSAEIFLVDDDPDRTFFDVYKEQFGASSFVVVTMTCDELFTHENLRILQQLTKWLEGLEFVDDVTSLADIEDVKGADEDFIVEPFFDEVPELPEELRALRERALDKPLYVRGVVSADGNTAGIIVELIPNSLSDDERATLVKTIRRQIRQLERDQRRFAVAGREITEYFLRDYLNRDMSRLMPISVGLMLIILFLFFRHPLGILLPSLLVGTAMVGGNGALVLVGGTNNMVTSILPPLMMATGIALSIHLLNHYHEFLLTAALPMGDVAPSLTNDATGPVDETGELMDRWQERLHAGATTKRREPETTTDDQITAWLKHLGEIKDLARNNSRIVTHVVRELWRPCLAAAITTMAGFGSLAISHVPPIRHFGIAASFGVAYTLLMAFTLLPALLVITRRPVSRRHAQPEKTDALDGLLAWLGKIVIGRPRTILCLVGAVTSASAVGVLSLRIETNGLEFFFADSPLVRDTNVVESHLAGTEDLRISLRAVNPDALVQPETLAVQEDLAQWLRNRPEIDKVVSLPDYLKDMNRAFHGDDPQYYQVPGTAELTAQYLLLYDGDDLKDVIDDDRSWAAVTARVSTHGVSDLAGLVDDTRDELGRLLPAEIEARVTGNSLLTVNLIAAIMGAQIQSLALASLLIFAAVTLLFRSVRDGLLSMAPNLLPILINLGLMGWLDIPLNPATAMISAVAIGIAVDDTVHFLSAYRTAKNRGVGQAHAIGSTLLLRGRAMISTSVVLFCAFAVLTISSFVPIVHFGLLTGLTMISALLADLWFFPALLLLLDR